MASPVYKMSFILFSRVGRGGGGGVVGRGGGGGGGGGGGVFWEVVVGVHRPPHLIFKLFQCKSLPVFVAGVCVYTVCPGYTPYSQSPPS